MKRIATTRVAYHSYLLRLWQDGAHSPWRASLQCTATTQVYYFATIEALWAFLQRQTDSPDAAQAEGTGTGDIGEEREGGRLR